MHINTNYGHELFNNYCGYCTKIFDGNLFVTFKNKILKMLVITKLKLLHAYGQSFYLRQSCFQKFSHPKIAGYTVCNFVFLQSMKNHNHLIMIYQISIDI